MTDENRESGRNASERNNSDREAGTEGGGAVFGGRSDDRGHRGRFRRSDNPDAGKGGALEVTVEHNIEKAIKILKRKLIKEGLFKELKMRRYYEKPSERKKRKHKESLKKQRKEESRIRKNQQLL